MEIQAPARLQGLYRPKRFKIAFGGRGGAKTMSFCDALLYLAMQSKLRVLCCREFMNSIDDSVHFALSSEIRRLNMGAHYRIQTTRIIGANGSEFRYAGLRQNVSSIKSKHEYDIVWIEEAETVSQHSLDVLIPTMRKAGSEIWASYNPEDEFSPIHSYVRPHMDTLRTKGVYDDDLHHIVRINLEDNPFAPQELVDDSERMRKDNYKRWLHVYGGEVYSDYSESIIQPEWVDAAIDAHF